MQNYDMVSFLCISFTLSPPVDGSTLQCNRPIAKEPKIGIEEQFSSLIELCLCH